MSKNHFLYYGSRKENGEASGAAERDPFDWFANGAVLERRETVAKDRGDSRADRLGYMEWRDSCSRTARGYSEKGYSRIIKRARRAYYKRREAAVIMLEVIHE